jgi:hypothetical protein
VVARLIPAAVHPLLNSPLLNALRQFQQQTERLVEAGQLPAAEGRRFIDLTEQIVEEL